LLDFAELAYMPYSTAFCLSHEKYDDVTTGRCCTAREKRNVDDNTHLDASVVYLHFLSNSPRLPWMNRDSQARENEDGRVQKKTYPPATPFTYILTPATLEETKMGDSLTLTNGDGGDGGGKRRKSGPLFFFPITYLYDDDFYAKTFNYYLAYY
jgi:hypothetical protein